MSSWKEYKLGEIGTIKTGKTPPAKCQNSFSEFTGIPFVTPKDMVGNKWISDTERYLTHVGFNEVSNYLVNENSISVSCIGSDMGKAVLLKNKSVTNQQINTLTVSEEHNYEYVYYVLSRMQVFFKSIAGGSATPILNKTDFSNIEILLPDLDTQNKTVEYLKYLDEKIQLNIQINQTLEQIAQTIFKSWFIDFDPVHAKAEALTNGQTAEQATQAAMAVISGKNMQELHRLQTANPEQYQQLWEIADAFPSGVDEEGVPRGWEMTTFGNVSQCFDKKRIPLSKRQREQRAGSIPYYGATSVMDYVDEAIFDDIYLLIGEDGSVLKEDGSPFIQYIWGKAWVNNHAHVLQGKGSVSTEQLMLFMASTNITAYVTGAVQMKLNQANMNSIPFVKATDRVNELFFDLIKDLYAKIRSNTDENRFLVKIREELLPKLLSGEILNGN